MKTHPGIDLLFQGDRTSFCRSLVHAGVQVVRDGKDHSAAVNRCLAEDGKCVGTYEVLCDYDAASDTFAIGWKQRVPAEQVEDVAAFDVGVKFLNAFEATTGLNRGMLAGL